MDHIHRADDRFELVARHAAGPEQGRAGAGEVDDGRLDADGTRAAVEDQVDAVAQLGPDVVGRRRAYAVRPIGTGGGDGPVERG